MEETQTQEKASFGSEQAAGDFFDTKYLKADLKGRSLRGGTVTVAAQAARFFLLMGSTMVLARLLTPEDFGLLAMVTAITNFVRMFKDIGLSTATIQKADINHTQISTLFWINVAIGLTLAVVTVALAPAVSWFYSEPRLTLITLALAIAFIFGGLSVQHQALLQRHMRFSTLAAIQITSTAVSVVIAIAAALYGLRYWALVLMQIAEAVVMMICVWIASSWCPGWPRRDSRVRSMLAFGGNVTGSRFAHYFARNLDRILLGRFHGSFALGIYSKAYSILMLPINQIRTPLNMVALPALSSIQKEQAKFAKYYTKLLSFIAFASMPLTAYLAVCSESIIRLLLGNQWLQAAGIFQVLAITAFIQPVAGTRGALLLSLGQSGRYLKVSIFQSLVLVVCFAAGLPWGPIGVATSYTISNYLILYPLLWYSYRFSPVSVKDFLRAIWRAVVASLGMGAVLFLLLSFMAEQSHVTKVAISFVTGAVVYPLIWLAMPGGIEELNEMRTYFSLIFSRNKRI